jgi:altronate dehydratase
MKIPFEEAGRLASPQDNVAIAIHTLRAGTSIVYGDRTLTLKHTVLEGHRFAVRPIQPGEALLSWGQPFGTATAEIAPGDYLRNEAALRALRTRSLDFPLPDAPNFADQIAPFVFDEAAFTPAPERLLYDDRLTFQGYRRPGKRGVGTRNTIVLLGTSSLTAGFVRALEARLKPLAANYANIDAVIAVAHTEGGHAQINNRDLLLRTLAGFMIHPNVGAVVAVDYGTEAVNNAVLRDYMKQNDYPLADVSHHFMSLSGDFQYGLDSAAEIVQDWLDDANRVTRSPQPVSELKIALQCGGSDAFSGISGNPLAAWVAKEILHYGGMANLAETDELIGAEAYVLQKVRDVETAHKFLATVERFKEWAGWHGHTADGNPSGGNIYRGLYNIYLKSLGAATKRHPDVRLDHVIDYSQLMQQPGFYFMDSPGNDLESIAGQVASGCNLIFFVTGNGSITNFPFVPTIKIVTTTERYQLLSNEMDVNAGAYLDGVPLDDLGRDTLRMTLEVASGKQSVGERAGHAQVQLWRNWQLTGAVDLDPLRPVQYDGKPHIIDTDVGVPDVRLDMLRVHDGYAADQIGLILPTSLCSGQIARICVNRLNEMEPGRAAGLSRFVTLVHTEGCGMSDGSELTDTLLGYLLHPQVKYALLLEHGCEKTHNDYIRHQMIERGFDPQQYGWASVQLDGGIQNVTRKMTAWFDERLQSAEAPERVNAGLGAVRLALVTHGDVTDELAAQFAQLTRIIVAAGGTVVIPHNDALLGSPAYLDDLSLQDSPPPTLNYAHHAAAAGFHIMEAPTQHWGETLTGLGAAGVELILAHINVYPMTGHPLVPVLQVTGSTEVAEQFRADLDGILQAPHEDWSRQLLDLIAGTLSQRYTPRLSALGNTDFQITRGLLGVSL